MRKRQSRHRVAAVDVGHEVEAAGASGDERLAPAKPRDLVVVLVEGVGGRGEDGARDGVERVGVILSGGNLDLDRLPW